MDKLPTGSRAIKLITSAEEMVSVIRTLGLVPFSKCTVPGWSIQELTHPDYWFMSSDELGPWDWKIDAVQAGIVYGKFLSRKSAFATEEAYRHLMNWRRSVPYYGMAEGGKAKCTTINERLQKYISPYVLQAIRERGTLESGELRSMMEKNIPVEVRKKVGGYIGRHLIPKVSKEAVDFVMQYLDMGTWTVIGDITRVYRGPNCEYKGWQRNSVTTPDLMFRLDDSDDASAGVAISKEAPANVPFWAKFIEDEEEQSDAGQQSESIAADCTPEESKDYLVQKLSAFFPDATKALEKVMIG